MNTIRNNIYKNPLLLIGSEGEQEQMQLLTFSKVKNSYQITVNRGINFNRIIEHKVNSSIKIFPYQDLSLDFLRKMGLSLIRLLINNQLNDKVMSSIVWSVGVM